MGMQSCAFDRSEYVTSATGNASSKKASSRIQVCLVSTASRVLAGNKRPSSPRPQGTAPKFPARHADIRIGDVVKDDPELLGVCHDMRKGGLAVNLKGTDSRALSSWRS